MKRQLALAAGLAGLALGFPALADPQQGCCLPNQLFPSDNPWNQDITWAPVDWRSDDFIWFLNRGGAVRPHPDFGGNVAGDSDRNYGFPYIVVDGWQPRVPVDFDYPSISDQVGYPIPDDAIWNAHWIQGGLPGQIWDRDEDRHILIVDRDNNLLYELFNVWFDLGRWRWVAGSGVVWNMWTNDPRPDGMASADESGMSMLPGILKYDEVYGGDEIMHALRISVAETNGYVYPATAASGWVGGALPLGARLRLKSNFDISGYPWDAQKILRAMKRYGLMVTTKCPGEWLLVSGTYDVRWNNDALNPAFTSLSAWDFEVVQLGWAP